MFYNTESRYDHGMAVNYRGKKFYNIGPWFWVRLLALPTISRPTWKYLPRTNALAYSVTK
jgi:hypothetical protein